MNLGYTAKFISTDFNDPHSYYYGSQYLFDIPFGYGSYLMVQIFDLFAITIDLGGTMYDGPIISMLPTLTIRPSSFEIDAFFGVGVNILSNTLADFDVLGGVRAGMKIGPGIIFAEARPIVSLGKNDYYAFFTNFTLGYQIGFISKKK